MIVPLLFPWRAHFCADSLLVDFTILLSLATMRLFCAVTATRGLKTQYSGPRLLFSTGCATRLMVEERATFALKSEATWDESISRAIVPSNGRGSLLQGACMDVDVTATEGHTLRFKYFARGGSKDV